MSSSDAQAIGRGKRSLPNPWAWLPPEHGFWVMLAASVLTAVLQCRGRGKVVLAAALTLVVAAAIGALIHRHVRGNGNAQLASAAAMSLAGVPIALAGGLDGSRVACSALAWAAVFLTSALIVRSTFARARSAPKLPPIWFDAAAIGSSAAACALFVALGVRNASLVTGLAALSAVALVASRPTVKRLKRVGLALAVLCAIASVLLAL